MATGARSELKPTQFGYENTTYGINASVKNFTKWLCVLVANVQQNLFCDNKQNL